MQRAEFTVPTARKVLEATGRVLKFGPPATGPNGDSSGPGMFFEGELLTACTAATNGKTGATTCTAYRWRPVSGSVTDPIALETGSDVFTLVNRSTGLHGAIGTYVIWARIGLEWRIIWIDCP